VTDGTDEFDSATRTATQEDEEAAFKELNRLFVVIDRWQTGDEHGNGLSVQPHSSLAADDRASNPYRLSHAAIHGIAGAIDHLHSLPMLIQGAASLHTFAPFTLNRAAIEGAAVAVWLLAPQSRDERIRRRLVLATQNARDMNGALTAMGETSELDDDLEDIREVAAKRPALDPDGIVGTPPGMERIIREAGDSFPLSGEAAVTAWKACSGITHNRQWASINLLDREELSRMANVRNLRLTASFKNVQAFTAISVVFSAEARRLFALRAVPHS
jgi:hypothetical protein